MDPPAHHKPRPRGAPSSNQHEAPHTYPRAPPHRRVVLPQDAPPRL